MLKKLRAVLIFVLLVGLVPVAQVALASNQDAPARATVDPTTVYVSNFEGWGTSLIWFANVTGGWSDTNRNALADAVYGSNGLRLNIARYNIGGSSASQQGMRPGGLVRSYLNSNGTYDWSVDANQRWWLSAAISRGANITEAFSNSPPWFMTISGDTRGAAGCGDNLQSSQNNAFAEYLTEVVKHFRDSWGVTFRTLDPLNEPNATWWCITGRQEGAHIGRSQQSTLVQLVGEKLVSKGLTGTTVSAPDETSPSETIGSINAYSTTAKNYISQINTHTYSGNATDKTNVRNLANSLGKRLWMSEVDGSSGTHNHNDISAGMWLAARITEDINYIRPAAWVHWQVIEDEANMISENQNWGLIHADMAGSSQSYSFTKKYYVMGNYTKFIRPGYRIIASGDSRAVTAYNPSTSTLVIVLYNNTTSNSSVNYNLTGFTTVAGPATVYRTSASENLVQLSNITISNRQFTATANANSVTTYVISGVSGTGPTATPGPTTPPATYYRITNRNSGKVADVNGGSTSTGATVIQWPWNGGNNQQWQFQDAGGGYFRVINRNSGLCMDVNGASTADGAGIIQWTCGSGTNQQWQWVATGSYFNLKARHSGKCVNVVGSSTADGALLEQRTCGTGNSFQWTRQ
jgi:O-glycosyl hydrolase